MSQRQSPIRKRQMNINYTYCCVGTTDVRSMFDEVVRYSQVTMYLTAISALTIAGAAWKAEVLHVTCPELGLDFQRACKLYSCTISMSKGHSSGSLTPSQRRYRADEGFLTVGKQEVPTAQNGVAGSGVGSLHGFGSFGLCRLYSPVLHVCRAEPGFGETHQSPAPGNPSTLQH
ncbi:low-density lipoprotein receptor-related protein 4-like [Platysternon megacephalum]|uniref:Low-density lipoprotein receptor-related protein 4-like n=1 Tax=Platysternon megacephalum TaxID=55544 RepID=A0A4D9E6A4_9SAUR|nr:low-density lipoprotein receptor-related protein 4-like [Platysternon megacephalum]